MSILNSMEKHQLNGLNRLVLGSIARIRTTFVDDLGNLPISGVGTGFWLRLPSSEACVFVTNQHNVNIGLRGGSYKNFKLRSIEIEFRSVDSDAQVDAQYFRLSHTTVLAHSTADVALIPRPVFESSSANPKQPRPNGLNAISWVANNSFFDEYVGVGGDLSFLGYPQSFCDRQYAFPIARHAIIASHPLISFKHEKVLTSDAVLVSGLSFRGGSGSPVFIASRGTQITTDTGSAQTSDYCPQRLIGIMTGHLEGIFDDSDLGNELERHSGLSYFTRATSIWELIDQLSS